MTRQAFVPPDEQEDDALSFLTSGAPGKPAARPGPQAVAAPVAEPEVGESAGAEHRDTPPPRETRRAGAGKVQPQPKPVVLPKNKRVGLYVDKSTWATLKRISLERAERGIPHDLTTIVLEALKKQYPSAKWGG